MMIENPGIMALKAAAAAASRVKPDDKPGAAELTKQFGSYLNDALNKVSEQKVTVDKLNEQFASGELTDIHKLLIASEKASLGLELTVQIRNKAIEAYQEIMRTQI